MPELGYLAAAPALKAAFKAITLQIYPKMNNLLKVSALFLAVGLASCESKPATTETTTTETTTPATESTTTTATTDTAAAATAAPAEGAMATDTTKAKM